MRIYAVPGGIINVRRAYNESKAFVFTVQTTGLPETFTLPLEASGFYDFTVDWGDSNSDIITTWNDAAVTHSYASAGIHTITIIGIIQGWRFNNGGDKNKIYDIKSWGSLRLGNSNGYFYGCSNLTVSAIDILNLTDIINFSHFFRDCSSLTNLDVSAWNTAAATAFYGSFRGCSSLTNLDVSAWNTAAVTSFFYCFSGCSSLTDPAINNWDITSVINATNFMNGAKAFSTAVYDATLIAWEAQAEQPDITIHFGTSKYTGGGAAATARTALVANGWVITDGGIA